MKIFFQIRCKYIFLQSTLYHGYAVYVRYTSVYFRILFAYATEADLINVALFGMIAKQWRDVNPGAKGNMRDYAGLNQLPVLANMESYNALLIEQKKEQAERLALLRDLAVRQMQTLSDVNMEKLPHLPGKM